MSVSSMQATHLFSFTDCHKWKQFCILHFASFAHCAQVVLSHCTIRSAVCAGLQSNNPRFVTALLSAHFSSHRLCEGLCISRLFLLSFFRPLRESGFWFIVGNHKTEQRNRSNAYLPLLSHRPLPELWQLFNSVFPDMLVLRIISLRASADEV